MKRALCILLSFLAALTCCGKSFQTRTVRIESGGRQMKMKVFSPKETSGPVPGVLWIHGGGFMVGGIYMQGMTCAPMLAGTGAVSKYASPSRETDYSGLPACYTFVMDGEPFYEETLTYVRNLQEAGVEARVDVYKGDVHAFDMMQPGKEQSKLARRRLREAFLELIK